MNEEIYKLVKVDIETYDPSLKLQLLKVSGELDAAGLLEFKRQINPVLENFAGLYLVFDLSRVSYVNSNSISFFMDLYSRFKLKSISVSIINSNGRTDESFELVGLKDLVPYFACLDDLIKSLS